MQKDLNTANVLIGTGCTVDEIYDEADFALIQHLLDIAREALPYYINRCIATQAELTRAKAELKVTDALLEERNRLLKTIPACDAHGEQCIPHAIAWVKESIEIRAGRAADKERIAVLQETLVKIEQRCDWTDRDNNESDKVLCNTQGIRGEIARVYPKCDREVE